MHYLIFTKVGGGWVVTINDFIIYQPKSNSYNFKCSKTLDFDFWAWHTRIAEILMMVILKMKLEKHSECLTRKEMVL